jgi:hypothetical protein
VECESNFYKFLEKKFDGLKTILKEKIDDFLQNDHEYRFSASNFRKKLGDYLKIEVANYLD